MTTKPVYRDGIVHVMREQCSTCVLRPGNLMDLRPGRVKDMVTNEVGYACHQTLYHDDSEQALCKAWVDQYGCDSIQIRLATAMDCLAYDGEPDTDREEQR